MDSPKENQPYAKDVHSGSPECHAAEEVLGRLFGQREQRPDTDEALAVARQNCPVHHSPALGRWVLTSYESVKRALRDQSMVVDFSQGMDIRRPDWRQHPSIVLPSEQMLSVDGPPHDRLRRIGLSKMNIRFVEHMQDRIQALVNEVVDTFVEAGGGDFVEKLAFPVTANVISDVMGLPKEDRDWYRVAVSDSLLAFDPAVTDDELKRADKAALRIRAFWDELVALRQKHPAADLVSDLLNPTPGKDQLTADEVVAFSEFLFSAGFETTVHTLSLGLLAFVQNPDQFRCLRENLALAPSMVEEVLRYTATIVGLPRMSAGEHSVGDQVIADGDMVFCSFASANRDPSVYVEPDKFDITREAEPHMTFGHGRHICLGAPLARAEIKMVFERLAQTCESIALAGPAVHDSKFQPRSLTSLPVKIIRQEN